MFRLLMLIFIPPVKSLVYDLFVYLFGDDIDFENGNLEAELDIKHDENIYDKLLSIHALSDAIELVQKQAQGDSDTLDLLLEDGGTCDQLLQQFHRHDEEIGEVGKWQGGTAVSVCRGRGTTKFLSLASMHLIVTDIWNIATANRFLTDRMIKNFVEECAVSIFVFLLQIYLLS